MNAVQSDAGYVSAAESFNAVMAVIPRLRPLRIGISLLDFVEQARHQPDLFDQPKPAQLLAAIDSLNAKFGRGAVSYGCSMPHMVSKIAFQRVPNLKEF